ncbi:cytochrome c2 [Rhodobacter sp.]
MTLLHTTGPAIVLALTLCAFPLRAEPDLAAGERVFTRCRACHAITAPDGTRIEQGGRTGPDLYGVIGRQAGSVEGFRYSPGLQLLNATGFIWSEETVALFAADPTGFLRSQLNDPGARTAMAFTLRAGGEDLAAWLTTHSPAE